MNNLSKIVYNTVFKYCENKNLDVIRNVMVIIIKPNVLIFVNIFQ